MTPFVRECLRMSKDVRNSDFQMPYLCTVIFDLLNTPPNLTHVGTIRTTHSDASDTSKGLFLIGYRNYLNNSRRLSGRVIKMPSMK